MRTTIESLPEEEASTLARIRLSTTTHLIAAATGLDKDLAALCLAPFSLSLSAIGVQGKARLVCSDGKVVTSFGEGASSAMPTAQGTPRTHGAHGGKLVFLNARDCARVLGGGHGTILPVPLGPAFSKAIQFFRAGAASAPKLLRSPDVLPGDKARLLLTVSLYGLEAVADEPYLEKRMEHFPDGSVQVEVGEVRFFVEKQGRAIHVRELAPASTAPRIQAAQSAKKPDAFLTFASPDAAIAVLSGKRQAVVALGSGEVAIAGLLPLVQGLFAVLDRLAWYLGITVEEEQK